MIFSSIEFLALFLPIFLAIYTLAPVRARNTVLLVASWIFYGWWSPTYLLLLVGITVVVWAGALIMDRLSSATGRKWLLAVLIACNASILFWFKYINMLVETLNDWLVFGGGMPISWQKVILPIGLSFVVLQAISYLVDVYRREVRAQVNFIWFAAYISMFGQLIAGPIIRYEWVERALAERPYDWENFAQGARRFMIGLSMKVIIADTLSPLVEVTYGLAHPSFTDAWLACISYSLQLFFDFAGYSAMAIGLGQMLGFHFPENFNHPYLAKSIQDFWRRWHISLSTWIRDYLYIPLGGNRKGQVRTYVNLLLTMAIAGLWHGSDNWNFLIWGLMHGFALVIARIWNSLTLFAIPGLISRIATILFVCMAWVVFRASDLPTAISIYKGQLGLNSWQASEQVLVALQSPHLAAIALGVLCTVLPAMRASVRTHMPDALLKIADLWPVATFVLALGLISSRKAVPFLYFQF